ncbi:MAG: metallophosphoesterase [Candidatus Margulisiibacteriota bacterium]
MGIISAAKQLFGARPNLAQQPAKVGAPRISATYQRLTVDSLSNELLGLSKERLIARLSSMRTLFSSEKGKAGFFTRDRALLTLDPAKKTIVVGDLHSNIKRLDKLLDEYGPQLASGELQLVFLGDIVHPERKDLCDLTTFLKTLSAFIVLKSKFPDRVHVIEGNHDIVFKENDYRMAASKINIPQAYLLNVLLEQYMKETLGCSRGETKLIISLFQSFFDQSPRAAIVEGTHGAVYMAHSAVVKGGITREALAASRSDEELSYQLLNNRPIGCGGPNYTFIMGAVPVSRDALTNTADFLLKQKYIEIVKGEVVVTKKIDGVFPNDFNIDANITEEERLAVYQYLKDIRVKSQYREEDFFATRQGLGLHPYSWIVSGHTPREGDWKYIPFEKCPRHAIIHGNVPGKFGVMVIERGDPTFRDIDDPAIADSV